MSNVRQFPRQFDAEVDTALNLFEPTSVDAAPPTAPIEFGRLLQGPALPVTRPSKRPVREEIATGRILFRFSVVSGAYLLGVVHASVIIACFR